MIWKLSAEAALLWLAAAMLWAAQPGADNASNRNSINRSSEPQGQELVYAARISLDRTQMQTPIDNRKTPRLYSQGPAGANYLLAQGLHP